LNRNSALTALSSQSFAYDANDRLATDTYDANGNTLVGRDGSGAPLGTDRYDFEDRLIERRSNLNASPSVITMQYDGDGNRVGKTVNGVNTYYLVDDLNPTGYAQVLEERVSLGSQPPILNRVYTYGHDLLHQDQLLSDGQGGWAWQTSFYGYDGHGSVRSLTDLSGTVTDTYDYDAYGVLLARQGTTPNHYLYSGEQFEPGLGLYYLRARYLNPDTGRFCTADSFEGFATVPASLHRYTYSANDPVNALDPSGHYTLAEVRVATAIASTINSMVVNAGIQTMHRAQADLARAGVGTPEFQEAIDTLLWYQLVSDLYAGYSAGRLGAATLPAIGKAMTGRVLWAMDRLQQLSPRQWLNLKLFGPKELARQATQVEHFIAGGAGLSCGAAKSGLGRVTGSFDAFNPGPISDDLAATFSGGRYREVVLDADTVLYRAGDGSKPLGQFFDLILPQGITQARIDKAILARWPGGGTSPINSVIGVRIPKDTKIYVGEVSSQGGIYLGGTQQIVIPTVWKIPGVTVESIAPLR
jgi:RHS repeat-associated protein